MVLTDTMQIYERAHLGGSLNELKEQIDYRDELGQTALMHAVVEDNDHDTTALKNLLTFGADPNVVSSQQRYTTTLTIAVNLRKVEHVRELIRAGAFFTCERGLEALKIARENEFLDDVLIGDEAMKTRPNFSKEKNAFHVAYKYKCFDLLLDLINYGVTTSITSIDLSDLARADLFNVLMNSAKTDIDEQDDKGQTTLMRAVQHNKTQIVQSLIQKGACLDVVNLEEETVLHIACRGPVDMVKILLDAGAKTEIYNKNNLTPLAVATHSFNIEIMTIMLAAGADINCRCTKGETLLMMAIRACEEQIIKFLNFLNSQVNINTVEEDLNTALHSACDKKSFCVPQRLTPFSIASRQRNTQLMKQLAQSGADVNCQDENQRTPLVNAVISRDVNMTEVLLDLGADVNILDNEGASALFWAARKGIGSIFKTLLCFKAKANYTYHKKTSALFDASTGTDTKIVPDLINLGPIVNVISRHEIRLPKPYITSHLLKEVHEKLIHLSEEKVTILHIAISMFSPEIIKLLIQNGADVMVVDGHGRTPIHIAAARGSLEIVESLRQCGAGINVVDKYGNSPLFVSILYNHKELTKYLLEYGADVNLICDSLCSPLFVAVLYNDTELVKLLIQHGAVVDKGKDSELLAALRNQNVDLVNILLDIGADINAKDGKQRSSLSLAIRSCFDITMLYENVSLDSYLKLYTTIYTKEEIEYGNHTTRYGRPKRENLLFEKAVNKSKALTMSLVSHGASVSDRDNEGNTCVHVAARYCGEELLEMFIDLKADIDVQNNNGETLLMTACRYGNVEGVHFLLTLGADVMLVDQNKDTALHHLVRYEVEKLTGVDFLLGYANQEFERNRCESDPNEIRLNPLIVAKNKYGETALSIACKNGHGNIIKQYLLGLRLDRISSFGEELLSQYCDYYNEVNDLGDTPLIISIKHKHDGIAKLLLDLKANLHVQDKNGETALHIAVKHSMERTVQDLIQNGACVNVANNNGDTPIHFASTVTIAKCLLDIKSDLNIQNHIGEKDLLSSFKRKKVLVASLLIKNGADLNFATSTGETALMYAADIQNFTLIQLLVEGGANVNTQDREGRTPLMHVVMSKISSFTNVGSMGTEAMCEYLYSKGADLNKTNKRGETVCMMAVQKGRTGVLEKLVLLGADLNILDKENKSALVHALLKAKQKTDETYLNNVLQLGLGYDVHENYKYVVKELFCNFSFVVKKLSFYNIISSGLKHLFQLFLANGLVFGPSVNTMQNLKFYCDSSNICCALALNHLHFVKYFFATGCIFQSDMHWLRQITRADPNTSNNYSWPLPKLPTELQSALNEPWPLVKLAFIEVSTLLGTGHMREEKLKQTKLPPRMQRTLMFQEPISRLPVEDWSKISLCFDPVKYETLPCPRPLLYYWPVGHRLVN